jgi:hypothetical protein
MLAERIPPQAIGASASAMTKSSRESMSTARIQGVFTATAPSGKKLRVARRTDVRVT